MNIVRTHKGITWATADLASGEFLWPEGIKSSDQTLIWILESDKDSVGEINTESRLKGIFCVGKACDELFEKVKRHTQLYVKAEDVDEVVTLVQQYVHTGDTIVYTGVNRGSFEGLVKEME